MTPKVFGRAISRPEKSIATEQPAAMEFRAETNKARHKYKRVVCPSRTEASLWTSERRLGPKAGHAVEATRCFTAWKQQSWSQ